MLLSIFPIVIVPMNEMENLSSILGDVWRTVNTDVTISATYDIHLNCQDEHYKIEATNIIARSGSNNNNKVFKVSYH
jgi:anionic cell wall polymer biosynthesis LytR-Cps2A-Psr (LCP) family protein